MTTTEPTDAVWTEIADVPESDDPAEPTPAPEPAPSLAETVMRLRQELTDARTDLAAERDGWANSRKLLHEAITERDKARGRLHEETVTLQSVMNQRNVAEDAAENWREIAESLRIERDAERERYTRLAGEVEQVAARLESLGSCYFGCQGMVHANAASLRKAIGSDRVLATDSDKATSPALAATAPVEAPRELPDWERELLDVIEPSVPTAAADEPVRASEAQEGAEWSTEALKREQVSDDEWNAEVDSRDHDQRLAMAVGAGLALADFAEALGYERKKHPGRQSLVDEVRRLAARTAADEHLQALRNELIAAHWHPPKTWAELTPWLLAVLNGNRERARRAEADAAEARREAERLRGEVKEARSLFIEREYRPEPVAYRDITVGMDEMRVQAVGGDRVAVAIITPGQSGHSCHMPPDEARRYAADVLASADEVDRLRALAASGTNTSGGENRG